MNPIVEIVIFGIHIIIQQQQKTLSSNLAAAVQGLWFAKSKSVWAETRLKMSCSFEGDLIKGFSVLTDFSIFYTTYVCGVCGVAFTYTPCCLLLCSVKHQQQIKNKWSIQWCNWFDFEPWRLNLLLHLCMFAGKAVCVSRKMLHEAQNSQIVSRSLVVLLELRIFKKYQNINTNIGEDIRPRYTFKAEYFYSNMKRYVELVPWKSSQVLT